MNIEHIRTFLEIASTGNFNRAADNLNITQSTVSARIKGLEERLDRMLFVRSRSGVELTPAGRQFMRYAVNLVRTWEQARQEVALPTGYRATIGLGAQVSLWERLILKLIPWMRRMQPDVALRTTAGYSPDLMTQLSDGLIDIGVMYQPRQMPGLVVEKLLEEKLVLVCTRRNLKERHWSEDYVYVDWGRDFWIAHREAFPDLPTPGITVWLGTMGLQYILENGGSGYFALRSIRPLLESKRLFRVPKAPVFKRPAYLVYPESPVDPEPVAVAREGLLKIVAEDGRD